MPKVSYVLFQQKYDRQTARSRANKVKVPRTKKQIVSKNEELIATSSRLKAGAKEPTGTGVYKDGREIPQTVKYAKHEKKYAKIEKPTIEKNAEKRRKAEMPKEEKPVIPKFSNSSKTVYKGKVPPQIVPQKSHSEKYITLSEDQLR